MKLKTYEAYSKMLISLKGDSNKSISIKKDDIVSGGKFKNKKVKVKSINMNGKGDITINGKPYNRFRKTDIKEIDESNYYGYKKGDYVLLDLKKMKERDDILHANNLGAFDDEYESTDVFYTEDKKFARIYYPNIRDEGFQESEHRVKFSNNNVYDAYESEIIRLLTPDEIEEYEARKNANKYNL